MPNYEATIKRKNCQDCPYLKTELIDNGDEPPWEDYECMINAEIFISFLHIPYDCPLKPVQIKLKRKIEY